MKISEEITEILRDDILAGIYKPRQRLIEEELSERFFVSRTPIREALKRLETAGLIEIEPYKGAFIADIDLNEIRDSYELRCVLESFVTEHAVAYITTDVINQLQCSMERMENCILAGDNRGFAQEDHHFHALIFDHCPNKVAVKVLNEQLERTAAFRRLSWRTTGGMQNSMKGHKNILDAIKAGDPEAASIYASRHIRLYLKENLSKSE